VHDQKNLLARVGQVGFTNPEIAQRTPDTLGVSLQELGERRLRGLHSQPLPNQLSTC